MGEHAEGVGVPLFLPFPKRHKWNHTVWLPSLNAFEIYLYCCMHS